MTRLALGITWRQVLKDPTDDKHIGVGRFRILGGQGLEYWGAKGGGNFPAGS